MAVTQCVQDPIGSFILKHRTMVLAPIGIIVFACIIYIIVQAVGYNKSSRS